MIREPTIDELLEAVSLFLEGLSGQLADREKFLARVAMNALGVVRRELREGPGAEDRAIKRLCALLCEEGDYQALNRALCVAVQQGRFDGPDEGPLLAHLRASAIDRVQIDQPAYSGLKAAKAGLSLADESRRE